jgi:hypothetical protein
LRRNDLGPGQGYEADFLLSAKMAVGVWKWQFAFRDVWQDANHSLNIFRGVSKKID